MAGPVWLLRLCREKSVCAAALCGFLQGTLSLREIAICQWGGRKLTLSLRDLLVLGFPQASPKVYIAPVTRSVETDYSGVEISSVSAVFYAAFLIPCLPYPPQPGFLSMLLLSALGLGTLHSCCAPRAHSVWPLCGTEDHGMVDDCSVHTSTGLIPSPHLGSKQLCKKGLLEELG